MQSQALLKNETEHSYYKVITKWDRSLLQSASVITKCDSYYKVRHNNSDPVVLAYVGISFFQVSHLSVTSKLITEQYVFTILPLEKSPASLFIEKHSLRTESATRVVL